VPKVAASRRDKEIKFNQFTLILPAALDPGVCLAFNINEYQKQENILGELSAAGVRG
jgi:hypothetical protein